MPEGQMPSEAFTDPVGEVSVEPRIPQSWFETHLDFVNHFTGQQHAVPSNSNSTTRPLYSLHERKDQTVSSPAVSKGEAPLAKAGIGSGVSTAEKRKLVGLNEREIQREKRIMGGEQKWL
jgi:hypothetical protein